MIDKMTSLVMSMHANPGVYALLLGSGVSRTAQIPTGWEIVTDLVRKVANLKGEDCGTDPCEWFEAEFGHPPSYSELLEQIGRTRAERSQFLRAYFEPTEDELEDGAKRPTAAHRAIAKLVRRGFVRVILTTNFDRLMEQALTQEGVSPTVVASSSALKGAQPLVHSNCTVVKLHGDYMDLHTRNTPVELESYDSKWKKKLNEILEDFGLVIAGWSGDWDTALCEAIRGRRSRRYTIWWTTRGKLSETATELCEFCRAEELQISGADEFFSTLVEQVEALETIDSDHPISAKIAVALTKKYISESKYRIRLHDLLMGEVDNTLQQTSPENMPLAGQFSDAEYVQRIHSLDSYTANALCIVSTGCFWDRDGSYIDTWYRAVSRLAVREHVDRSTKWMSFLAKEPARLLLYAAGIAFAANEQWDCIYGLLSKPRFKSTYRDDTSLAHFFQDDSFTPDVYKKLPEFDRRKTPISDHMFATLRPIFLELIPIDSDFSDAFDIFEVLQSLWFVDAKGNSIDGRFMWKDRNKTLERIIEDVQDNGEHSQLFRAGFFGGDLACYEKSLGVVQKYVSRHQW